MRAQGNEGGWITKHLENLINGSHIRISLNQRAEFAALLFLRSSRVIIRNHSTSAVIIPPCLRTFWLATVDRARSVHARWHGGLG